ncbi:argininosuccinate lyase, partial [candidate division KSB1 bacterium]
NLIFSQKAGGLILLNTAGQTMKTGKIWQGRFSRPTATEMEKFSHSLSVDRRLWREDLAVNRAWTEALVGVGLLTPDEFATIQQGLNQIEKEMANNEFPFHPNDEDIHSAIERRLSELIGDKGAKIHTGRSRNDQVITDLFLYLRKQLQHTLTELRQLQEVLVNIADSQHKLIMPGYTHLQQAQPVLFSHYVMSLFWILERDRQRLQRAQQDCGTLPLGSGALAGSGFAVDRHLLAQKLGFTKISENSIDAVSHRDVPIEIAFHLTQLLLHMSRYAADLILWSTQEFNFVSLDQAYCTGSSMMPQKCNPDSLELLRGKAASAVGHLQALLTLCHGLPHTYNRDLQEDKPHIFAILDLSHESLLIFRNVWATLKINDKAIKEKLGSNILATELADYLTTRGMPFRESHQTVGRIVRWAEENNLQLENIPLEKYQEFSALFSDDVKQWLKIEHSVARRNLPGGTGPKAVHQQILQAKKILQQTQASTINPA